MARQTPEARAAELAMLRAELAAKIPQASEFEQEILADGFVTRAEADRAAAQVIVCTEARGIETKVEWDDRDNALQFTIRVDNDMTRVDTLHECQEQISTVLEALGLQNALDEDQEKQLERLMIDCLAAQGIEIDKWPTANVDAAAEATCYDSSIVQI